MKPWHLICRRNDFTKLLITILATAAGCAFGQSAYTAFDLGIGGAFGINNAGTVVGYRTDGPGGGGRAFKYCAGQMTDLGSFGGPFSGAYAINNSSVIVGNSYLTNGGPHAFRYSEGIMTDLGHLGGGISDVYAINDAGTIVGGSNTGDGTWHAFRYDDGHMSDLGILGGFGPLLTGINSAGIIIGTSWYTEGATNFHAFIYNNGQVTNLGTPGRDSDARGINEAGTVVGGIQSSNGAWHPFVYNNGQLTDLGFYGFAYAINNAGVVVGGTGHAFSFSDGVMTDLSPYLSGLGFTDYSIARGINDNGDIVGCGSGADGIQHGFLLAALPRLFVKSVGSKLTLSWFTNAARGFSLCECVNLTQPDWQAVTNAPVVTNHQHRVIISKPAAGSRFYRLQAP